MTSPNPATVFIATRLAQSNLSTTFTEFFGVDKNAALDIFARFYASSPQMTVRNILLQPEPDKSKVAEHMLWQSSQRAFGRKLSEWFKEHGSALESAIKLAMKSEIPSVRGVVLSIGSLIDEVQPEHDNAMEEELPAGDADVVSTSLTFFTVWGSCCPRMLCLS